MVDNYYHGKKNDVHVCSLLSCELHMRSLFSVKMASKEWDDSQELTEFKQPLKKTRFKHPMEEEEILELFKGFVAANTKKNTMWAYKVFLDWLIEGENNTEEQCSQDLLENPNIFRLNYWLTRFVAEVRRQDGKLYPPKTIHQLLAVLQRKMLHKKPDTPKFLNRHEFGFRDLMRMCDSVYKDLHSKGIGTDVCHTFTLSAEDEE